MTAPLKKSKRVVKCICAAIDHEYQRILSEQIRVHIAQELFTLHSTADLSTLFTPRGIETLKETIFSDTVFRNYILQVTARFSYMLEHYGLIESEVYGLVVAAASRLSMMSTSQSDSIVHDITKGALIVDSDELILTLRGDLWITVIYLHIIHFHRSGVYHYLTELSAKGTSNGTK